MWAHCLLIHPHSFLFHSFLAPLLNLYQLWSKLSELSDLGNTCSWVEEGAAGGVALPREEGQPRPVQQQASGLAGHLDDDWTLCGLPLTLQGAGWVLEEAGLFLGKVVKWIFSVPAGMQALLLAEQLLVRAGQESDSAHAFAGPALLLPAKQGWTYFAVQVILILWNNSKNSLANTEASSKTLAFLLCLVSLQGCCLIPLGPWAFEIIDISLPVTGFFFKGSLFWWKGLRKEGFGGRSSGQEKHLYEPEQSPLW